MSRTFTKLFLAVAMLLGLLNTAFAEKYKATMVFSGNASGESKNVDAEITDTDGGYKAITFTGFNVSILTEDLNGISATLANLFYDQGADNSLTFTSNDKSRFEFADSKLPLSEFSTEIDANGNGKGNFTCSIAFGPFSQIIKCSFTLEKFVDTDTIVSNEFELNNVPFYNKVVDLNKVGDTTKTNNDSTAVGIRLYNEKAEFAMSDFEIAIGELKLSQRLSLENLAWAEVPNSKNIHITGNTLVGIKTYNDMTVPAVADIYVLEDGAIDGTIDITVEFFTYRYQITVVFGKQAEGVVIETKVLEYEKSDFIPVKSDGTFANDNKIYINESGILIEDIDYPIVDQKMTLLIKDFTLDSKIISLEENEGTLDVYNASKAEAYITVKGETVYLKDVDIELNLTAASVFNYDTFGYGALTIVDGGALTNEFLDPQGPIVLPIVGRNITMTVDTTGNNLDGYTKDSEFGIMGVFDIVDGDIETVKLADLDAAREAAINEAKNENGHGFEVEVVATDKAGNSTKFKTTCYAKPAPVSIEEIAPKVSAIRVVADSLTGKAIVNLDSVEIKYVAKNENLGLSKELGSVPVQVSYAGSIYELPREIEMPVGNDVITYIWENPYTGEAKELTADVKVYETVSNMTSIANVANKAVSVIYKNGILVVDGAKDANVSIVNISGATVYSGKAGAINLHKGIYIVKVDGKAYKVVVK